MTKAVCNCLKKLHQGKMVVLTGGPGAGKTAILEAARRIFCEHVIVLPEAASILFSGGFPRMNSAISRRAAQRAIFHIQRELEQQVIEEQQAAVILCDRGVVDGLAYWPDSEESFWAATGSSRITEFARYSAVIHLRTPGRDQGYNQQNPMRTEDAEQAAKIDEKILEAWKGHPNRFEVGNSVNFLQKMVQTTEIINQLVPDCCKRLQPPGTY